jgi:hypothetical protein
MTALGLHDRDCNALLTLGSSITLHFYILGMIIPPQTTMTVIFCFIQFAVKYLFKLFRRPYCNIKYLLIYSEDPTATMLTVCPGIRATIMYL